MGRAERRGERKKDDDTFYDNSHSSKLYIAVSVHYLILNGQLLLLLLL